MAVTTDFNRLNRRTSAIEDRMRHMEIDVRADIRNINRNR
jgi:hypothetical protein